MKSVLAGILLLLALSCFSQTTPLFPGTISFTTTAAFSYNQAPSGIVATPASGGICTSSSYVFTWEQSVEDGPWIQVGTGSAPPAFPPLVGSTKIRRSVICGGELLYTNIVTIVPLYTATDYENRNYVREITVDQKGIRSWQEADQLPVGAKFQATTYLDGLGRSIQTVSKGVSSTTGSPGNDLVKHIEYDAAGRALKDFLPYPSGAAGGKYKINAGDEQAFAIRSLYGEPLGAPTYSVSETDGSPLNRITKVTPPGAGWAAATISTDIDFNTKLDDQVHIWSLDYTDGALPTTTATALYEDGTLLKTTTTQQGKQVIIYTDRGGNLILKKVQLANTPTDAYNGWICTYNIYDDFGRLCYQVQPEAVSYLSEHHWVFDVEGKVLGGLCFQYRYDKQGRNIWKKAPGAKPLQMVYDERDRLVFTQDGNQAAKLPAEWTATLYDELDRPILTTLYRTSKSVEELQTDAGNAVSTSITVSNTGEPIVDLVVDVRDPGISRYTATKSIEFIQEFQSAIGDEFVAEIDAAAATSAFAVATTLQNPISSADLNNPAVCTVLKYQFYDNYSFAGAKPFDPAVDITTAYSTSDPNVQPLATTLRTTGFATGSKVRVLGTNVFLTSTAYYDERGALIQSTDDNIKSGQDVLTTQYHFDGRVLSTHSKHTTVGTGYKNFGVLTRNDYDPLGRLTGIAKKVGNSPNFKVIATFDYDELGKLKTKHLLPGYTGVPGKSELDALSYSYNIVGNITGVNKDYSLKAGSAADKWSHFFGFYLGYEKTEGLFASGNLLGQVTGQLWSTQGDDVQRKYDYTYDNAGRLTKADYQERQTTNTAWSSAKMDFSVGGTGDNGAIKYDLNGNLLSMFHKGFSLASGMPVEIDRLDYQYFGSSNQLKKVTDLTTIGQYNGKAGDFKDGSNGSYRDYVYDANGNLIVDYNKDAYTAAASAFDDVTPAPASAAPAIKYNFLDKPEEITIGGKGVIKFVYDAEGNKLQKIFTPTGSTTPITTTYANNYVYRGDELQYIGFEEGRIRVISQVVAPTNTPDGLTITGSLDLPNGKKGVYDYYLRDYQQNVRMILTEETHVGFNTCTLEDARAAGEEPLFGQIGPSGEIVADNEVRATRVDVTTIPGQQDGFGWNNAAIGAKVSRLGGTNGKKVGPNALLKVMAGDEITATAQYFYKNAVTNTPTDDNLTAAVVSSLLNAITGSGAAAALSKEEGTTLSSNLNAVDNPLHNKTAPDANNAEGSTPKAYLTVLFFNERFEYVAEGSTLQRVVERGNSNVSLVLNSIKAPKNGYCYVYLSNESSEPVYFDNLRVEHQHGRIVEENHYYAYGLKIAALSSKKGAEALEGKLDNQHLYNGKELIEEGDLEWYDYGFRSYDPQIGRFPQLDPLTFEYPFLTPYQYASCDPITNIDVDGLEGTPALDPVVITTTVLKAKANVLSSGGSMLNGLTNILPSVSSIFYNVYANSRGNTILEPAVSGAQTPASITSLGEEWQYAGNKEEAYLDYSNPQCNDCCELTPPTDHPFSPEQLARMREIRANNLKWFWDQTPIGELKSLATGTNWQNQQNSRWKAAGLVAFDVFGGKIIRGATNVAARELTILSESELLRIGNAASRIKKPITVVGSRASGKAGAYSDWDYIIEELTNAEWKKIKNSLPGSKSILDNTPRNIDIFNGPINTSLPYITIYPH